MSPAMAAAAAMTGHLTDVRKLGLGKEVTRIKGPTKQIPIESSVQTTPAPAAAAAAPLATKVAKVAPAAGAAVGMPKFTIVEGVAAPMERANVDTDYIIAAKHL